MAFDIYPLLRPLLFRLDAEKAHGLAIAALKRRLVRVPKLKPDPVLKSEFAGFTLAHPVGLGAGLDKHAEVIEEVFNLGFSFVELGGVTPQPQMGNPAPRLFRVAAAHAIINRFGFNSVGIEIFARRLLAWRDTQTRSVARMVGINLGKNKNTANAVDDYVIGVENFSSHADFLTVNVSSPNTAGLRDMQGRAELELLLKRVVEARARSSGKNVPILLKIAPDIDDAQAKDIAEVALAANIDGIIVGNTTVSRPPEIPLALAQESGGLSGKPLFRLSTERLGKIYQLTQGRIPLIGCGGIFSGADAYAKIRAGASLVQIYTVLVYEGPFAVSRIVTELAPLLHRDGFGSIKDAVGADFRK